VTRDRDRGQAVVEVALSLPLLCVLLLGVVQVAVVARDRLAVQLAARAAARAAAASADRGRAVASGRSAVALQPLQLEVGEHGGTVTATASYRDPTDVPLIGALLPDITVSATVTMAVEPP
jgi:Flp pilus assembly protein TadG